MLKPVKILPSRDGALKGVAIVVLLVGFWILLFFLSFTAFESHLPFLVINCVLSTVFVIKHYSKMWLISAISIYIIYVLLAHTLPASKCGGTGKDTKYSTCTCVGIIRYRQLGMLSQCVGKRTHCYSGNVLCGKDKIKDCYKVQTEIPCFE